RKPAKRTSAVRLWASHCNEIEVGGGTGCALATTTAAASSAILEREHTNAKGVDRERASRDRGRGRGVRRGCARLRVAGRAALGARPLADDCERGGVVYRLARDRPPGRAGLLARAGARNRALSDGGCDRSRARCGAWLPFRR